jgi:hypothetical protein
MPTWDSNIKRRGEALASTSFGRSVPFLLEDRCFAKVRRSVSRVGASARPRIEKMLGLADDMDGLFTVELRLSNGLINELIKRGGSTSRTT